MDASVRSSLAGHRLWAAFQAHLAFAVAVLNLLTDWEGLSDDQHGRTHLTIAEFTL